MTIAPQEKGRLLAQVAEWLEAERQSVVGQLGRAGIPSALTVPIPVVTEITESSSSMTTELREANPTTTGSADVWRALRDREHVPGPAAELQVAYGRACFYQESFRKTDFDVHPVKWIEEHLLAPTSNLYVQSLARLGQPDGDNALKAADELVRFIEGDTVVVQTQLPVGGLRIASPLASGPVGVRPLTGAEIYELDYPDLEGRTELSRLLRFQTGFGERVMVGVEEPQAKTAWRVPTHLLQQVVLALQLLGFEMWGHGLATRRERPIPAGTLGTPIAIAKHGGGWRELTQHDLDAAVALAQKIPDETFTDPRSTETIALSRYSSASADRTATDALIDLVVALEAVLLPRKFEGELSFRLALFGAYATGADSGERPGLFKDFAKVYDTRSDIVHGKRVDANELQAIVATARQLTSRVLRRGLEQGWPSQDDLRAAVLM
jgi:hypothetical protein